MTFEKEGYNEGDNIIIGLLSGNLTYVTGIGRWDVVGDCVYLYHDNGSLVTVPLGNVAYILDGTNFVEEV